MFHARLYLERAYATPSAPSGVATMQHLGFVPSPFKATECKATGVLDKAPAHPKCFRCDHEVRANNASHRGMFHNTLCNSGNMGRGVGGQHHHAPKRFRQKTVYVGFPMNFFLVIEYESTQHTTPSNLECHAHGLSINMVV